MSSVVYHLLTESEPFSDFHGGAISRWAGNVLRNMPSAIVVCPSADTTWNFPVEAIFELSGLVIYRRLRRYLLHLPWILHRKIIRKTFAPLLRRLHKGDIVWIHNRPDFAIALAPYIRRSGCRVVLHLHNSHLVEWPYELMRQLSVDHLVFVSGFLLKQAQNKFLSLGTSSVLYNGADEAIFFPSSPLRVEPQVPIVLFVGRLVNNKGVHILIDAIRLLEQRGVKLHLRIVGSANFGSNQETEYVQQLKANSPTIVTFLPYCSGGELGNLFRDADIFCTPSIWDEPFGMVNVEAFASGLPVVSTRGGGAAEIFADGGGILVERGSVEQLATALGQLAEDSNLRSELGQAGHAIFKERFTWSVVRTQVQELHRSLSL